MAHSPRANICRWLYTIAILSYLADSMLVPFYPQYFKTVYGVDSPLISGAYIAACRIGMLISFQFWSRLTNRFSVMRILCLTQGIAGGISLLCAVAPTVGWFMAFSVLADIFKSSYLLLYPHIIRTAGRDREGSVISYMALIANLGIVLSVLIGGTLLDRVDARMAIVAVAILDWVQMLISLHIRSRESDSALAVAASRERNRSNAATTLACLCAMMFMFYFSLVSLRPFYTSFIESQHPAVSMTSAGIIFIIPNMMAVLLAPWGQRITTNAKIRDVLIWSCSFVGLCTILQSAAGSLLFLVASRVVYGAALFIVEIALDYLLFRWSREKELITNYSYINLSQNAAIILAPLAASYSIYGLSMDGPFVLSTLGAMLTVGIVCLFFARRSGVIDPYLAS
ncbi:MAG TPA: MFS transporter [Terrimicrobiaceae bacterium]